MRLFLIHMRYDKSIYIHIPPSDICSFVCSFIFTDTSPPYILQPPVYFLSFVYCCVCMCTSHTSIVTEISGAAFPRQILVPFIFVTFPRTLSSLLHACRFVEKNQKPSLPTTIKEETMARCKVCYRITDQQSSSIKVQ